MKEILYMVIKPKVYDRTLCLKKKQISRLERLKEVKRELNKWDDIPLSYQASGLCKKLRIREDQLSLAFLSKLVITNSEIEINKMAKHLPL